MKPAHHSIKFITSRCLVGTGARMLSVFLFLFSALHAANEVIPGAPAKELAQGVQKKLSPKQLQPTATPKRQTKIKIHGLTFMSEEQALGLLGNMIDHIVGHAPSPSRADDAAFLLEHTLRQQGLPEAQVDWRIGKRNRNIILNVVQGPSRHLGEVIISGVEPAMQEELVTYFKQETIGFNLLGKGQIPYIPSSVEEAVANVTVHMQSEGYWNAETSLVKTSIQVEQGLVNLHVAVKPGPLFLLAPPELRGPIPVDLIPLRQQLSAYLGLPANTQNINASRKTTLSYFLKLGYAFTEVQMDKETVGHRLRLIFTVQTGNRYKIGKINITGLERTDPSILQRRLNRSVGTLYNPEKVEENRRKFISTGAFSSMLIDTSPRNDGYIDITLRVQEGRARAVGTHLGAGSYEGGIFGLSYLDRNFRGKLQTLSVSGEFSGLGLLGQASINDPMLFGSDLNGTLRVFLLSHEFDGYKKFEAGLGAELVWIINDNYGMRFYGESITARTDSAGLPDEELGYTEYEVWRLGITQRLDFRDNALNPHKGFYAELLTEAGVVTGGSPIPYYKFELRSSYRQPFFESDFLTLTGRAGFNFNDDQTNYPIDLRFFLGGSDSVRSFPEREMGPSVRGDAVGGEAYWIASAEYNRKIKGPVYMNVFADAGALARDTSGLDTADVHLAAGLGFWLDLPIGPVRAEYGYNMNRRDGEPAGTFHFTIGVNF
ncbi:BamA/TamA family outer membrane protein [Verrucomicrobiaceae bacterium N1E253]|uniref:BamA/TamA family outer membrane protein n=1 Tax=Oceaniferula marina TaxID=2748318 RepID=A0A851GKR8_9BACT|nr:BamA/TamA family outer membrane protein [Oceaniferula marina]NWK56431.1 BamA/TamA family outer membrane protein [Oceaniferula marina]